MQRKLSNRNYKQASLEEYGYEIRRVWGHYLVERPCLYTWLRVVEHASTASEGVRRRQWDIVLKEAGRVIVWWLAFIGRLNDLQNSDGPELIFAIPSTPSEIIWSKYPGVCPVDFGLEMSKAKSKKMQWRPIGKISCRCLARKSEVEGRSDEEKAYAKRKLWLYAHRFENRRPRSILKMEQMFREIFKSQAVVLSTEEISFHFLEEVGEVSRALVDVTRSKHKKDGFVKERVLVLKGLIEELADVFSWTMTLVNRVRLDLKSFNEYFEVEGEMDDLRKVRKILGPDAEKVNITDVLWNIYGVKGEFRCDRCKKTECRCGDVRAVALQGKVLEKAKPALYKALRQLRA